MEKRKGIGLGPLIVRHLALTAIAGAATAVVWFLGLTLLQQVGLVSLASAGQLQATSFTAALEGGQPFDPAGIPPLIQYAYYDETGALVSTDLSAAKLATLTEGLTGTGVDALRWRTVSLPAGGMVVLHWQYLAQFTNNTLRSTLPPFEYLYAILLALLLLGCLLASGHALRRTLTKRLAALTAAAGAIAAQDLTSPIPKNSGIKEFDAVLAAMDDMRTALNTSLTAQWAMEQQREAEVTALAHDLNTPLTVISGNAELLLESPLAEPQKELAAFIHQSAGQATSYVDKIRHALHSGPEATAPGPIPVASLLGQLREATGPLAAQHGVSLQISGPVSSGQLIANAISHSPKGGTVRLTTTPTATGTLQITVRDDGPGFTAEALAHATERFWQGDSSRSAKGHHGLGLSIAAEAAKACGGSLTLETPPGSGALVTLTLPLSPE